MPIDIEALRADPEFQALTKASPEQAQAVLTQAMQENAQATPIPTGRELMGGLSPWQALMGAVRGEQRLPGQAKSPETQQFEAAHPTVQPLPPGMLESVTSDPWGAVKRTINPTLGAGVGAAVGTMLGGPPG